MKTKKMVLEDKHAKKLKLGLMGVGGVSPASKSMGVSYWRLSRIINGWLVPLEKEVHAIQEYIERRRKDLGL